MVIDPLSGRTTTTYDGDSEVIQVRVITIIDAPLIKIIDG